MRGRGNIPDYWGHRQNPQRLQKARSRTFRRERGNRRFFREVGGRRGKVDMARKCHRQGSGCHSIFFGEQFWGRAARASWTRKSLGRSLCFWSDPLRGTAVIPARSVHPYLWFTNLRGCGRTRPIKTQSTTAAEARSNLGALRGAEAPLFRGGTRVCSSSATSSIRICWLRSQLGWSRFVDFTGLREIQLVEMVKFTVILV
jgi:hypothetical protein